MLVVGLEIRLTAAEHLHLVLMVAVLQMLDKAALLSRIGRVLPQEVVVTLMMAPARVTKLVVLEVVLPEQTVKRVWA
jgi:hypothetical protein